MSLQNKDQWIEDRKRYLGGTDIAKLVGASPYGGPYDVYLQKTGQDPFKGNAATRAGQYLEPAVAQMYADATGLEVKPGAPVFHPEFSFLGGNPDFLTDDPDLGLEVKTAAEEMLYKLNDDGSALWGPAGTDEVPMAYLVQCQFYMGLTGRKHWDLAAFFLGPKREFRIYSLKFDPELYLMLCEAGIDFWLNHMETQTPPPMDLIPSDLVRAHIARKAQAEGNILEANADLEALAMEYRRAAEARKEAETLENEAKARMLEAMGKLGAQKIQGKTDGAKWSVAIQGGGTEKRVNFGLLLLDYHRKLLNLGVPESELEALEESYTQHFDKSPYLRGYFNSLKKAKGEPEPLKETA